VDPKPNWIQIQWGPWIRIRNPDPDPEGQKWPRNIENGLINFIFSRVGCSLLRAEGFSCSLDFLYGGQGISKLQFLIKKEKKISAVFFFLFWSLTLLIWNNVRKLCIPPCSRKHIFITGMHLSCIGLFCLSLVKNRQHVLGCNQRWAPTNDVLSLPL
jgi:hypothetical protein